MNAGVRHSGMKRHKPGRLKQQSRNNNRQKDPGKKDPDPKKKQADFVYAQYGQPVSTIGTSNLPTTSMTQACSALAGSCWFLLMVNHLQSTIQAKTNINSRTNSRMLRLRFRAVHPLTCLMFFSGWPAPALPGQL